MQIQIFSIPTHSNEHQIEEMNKFLRSHTIIDMEKHLVTTDISAYWTFCVRYVVGSQCLLIKSRVKIDYRDVLDENTFKTYTILRNCRKEIADKNGIPVYAVFTNEELANIAKLPEISSSNMKNIDGIGTKKIEKYAEAIIELYNKEVQ